MPTTPPSKNLGDSRESGYSHTNHHDGTQGEVMQLKKGQFALGLLKGCDQAGRGNLHASGGYLVSVCHVPAATINKLMSENDCVGMPQYCATDGKNVLFYPAANKRYNIDFYYHEIKRA